MPPFEIPFAGCSPVTPPTSSLFPVGAQKKILYSPLFTPVPLSLIPPHNSLFFSSGCLDSPSFFRGCVVSGEYPLWTLLNLKHSSVPLSCFTSLWFPSPFFRGYRRFFLSHILPVPRLISSGWLSSDGFMLSFLISVKYRILCRATLMGVGMNS